MKARKRWKKEIKMKARKKEKTRKTKNSHVWYRISHKRHPINKISIPMKRSMLQVWLTREYVRDGRSEGGD